MSRENGLASAPIDAIKKIADINGTEIAGCLDAIQEYLDIMNATEEGLGDAPIIDCIRARLQASKNQIERLCNPHKIV